MKKRMILILILFFLFIILTSPLVSAQQCETAVVKAALKKALFQYYKDPSSSPVSAAKIRDLLNFYLSIVPGDITANCERKGDETKIKMEDLVNEMNTLIATTLPKCSDGTEYGECSSFRPQYCYAGSLQHRCNYCGCPSPSRCSTDGKCITPPNVTNETAPPANVTVYCGDSACNSNETCSSCAIDCGNCPTGNLSTINLSGEVQITTNPANQETPVIYGNKIVWIDLRNIPGASTGYGSWGNAGDIYVYDLITKQETRITNSPTASRPAIYGNKIVWSDSRDPQNYTGYNFYGKGDIYMYDLTTGKETQITTAIGSQLMPHIYDHTIVWMDYRNSNSDTDIYMYDISTGTETKIGGLRDQLEHSPRIYGDRIIWSADYDIYLYEISTRRQNKITRGQNMEVMADIYGDKIVWVTQYEGGTNEFPVYVYDIKTKQQTRITSHHSTNFFPKIHGNRVVWQDYRTYNPDIYLYDLATGKEIPVVTDASYQVEPAIYDNKIVWMDYRNGNYDIYLATIS